MKKYENVKKTKLDVEMLIEKVECGMLKYCDYTTSRY